MKNLKFPILTLFVTLLIFGCGKETIDTAENDGASSTKSMNFENARKGTPTTVQKAGVIQFQPAGDFGGAGNVLNPGDFFPPGPNSFASLKRGKNSLKFNVHTTGLPEGAYTVWWIIFNEPGECNHPNPIGGLCGGDEAGEDLFLPHTSVLWATGGVVKANGVGNFSDRLYVGEQRDETIILGAYLGSPLENPQGAEVHLAIKYHGLVSDDPGVFYDQTHTLLGNCGADGGANSYDLNFLDPPFGPYQCFDPHTVIFVAPE